jgi:hypothetical protein
VKTPGSLFVLLREQTGRYLLSPGLIRVDLYNKIKATEGRRKGVQSTKMLMVISAAVGKFNG